MKEIKKITLLNNMKIIDKPMAFGEVEYLTVNKNNKNISILKQIGVLDSDIEDFSKDGKINIGAFIWDYLSEAFWMDSFVLP